jgi:CRP-like cAMP-binding protein
VKVKVMDTAEFLKHTTLFSGLSKREISDVLSTAKEKRFESGEVIIREGSGAAGFYLILDGAAEVRKADRDLATFGAGDYFGETALILEDTLRTADVVATAPTTCLVITPWDLKALIGAHPDMGIRMLGELAKRLRDTDQALSD